MSLSNYKKITSLGVFFLACVTVVSAQDSKTNLVGVTVLGEVISYNYVSPSIGFVFERKFTKRSGIEVGTYYRTKKNDIYIDVTLPDGYHIFETLRIRESYLTFPVLYRYYNKVVTLSAGPFVEAFVDWNQISPDKGEVTSYEISPSVKFGPLVKVSKSFLVGQNLSLEPELRYGVTVRPYQAFYGIGIQLKQSMYSKD